MRIFSVVTALTLVAFPLAAQRPQPVGLHPIGSSRPRLLTVRCDSIPQTYWATGLGIGAGLGVLFGGALQAATSSLCESSDCHGKFYPLAFLIPMLIFGTIGGMIGSGFHKGPR